MEPVLLTSKELSKIISMPVYTIRKLVREGVLPAYKISKKSYLFKFSEVINIIEKYRIDNKH